MFRIEAALFSSEYVDRRSEYAEADVLSVSPLPAGRNWLPSSTAPGWGAWSRRSRRRLRGCEPGGSRSVRRRFAGRSGRLGRTDGGAPVSPLYEEGPPGTLLRVLLVCFGVPGGARRKAGDRGLCSQRGYFPPGCLLFGKVWFSRSDRAGRVAASQFLKSGVSRNRSGRAGMPRVGFSSQRSSKLG
jgi:hypothetical protein